MLVVCRVCASEYSIGAPPSPAQSRAACLTCEDGPQSGSPFSTPLTARRSPPSRDRRSSRSLALGRGLAAFCRAPAFLVALAGLATTSAVVARAGIVTAIPQTAVLFAAAGLPVALGGLVLRDASSTLERQGERSVLVVEGRLANVTRGALAVPPVAIALRGSAGETVYRWSVQPSRRELGPGEDLTFTGRLAAPPSGIGDVEIALSTPGRDPAVASGTR